MPDYLESCILTTYTFVSTFTYQPYLTRKWAVKQLIMLKWHHIVIFILFSFAVSIMSVTCFYCWPCIASPLCLSELYQFWYMVHLKYTWSLHDVCVCVPHIAISGLAISQASWCSHVQLQESTRRCLFQYCRYGCLDRLSAKVILWMPSYSKPVETLCLGAVSYICFYA